jgi:uncharacterized membrane protein (GlpM family)
MSYLLLKGGVTAAVVIGISELAKRSSLLGAILASLPLTSILAMIWLYSDSKNTDTESVRRLSVGIFWMVLPSLFFFLAFPALLRTGMRFYAALLSASALTCGVYFLYVLILRKFGVEF